MRKGRNRPLISLETHIHAAFPRHPVKLLARSLDCSERQARRFMDTGRVPEFYRARIFDVLGREITRAREWLEALDKELKQIAFKEMVDRAQTRRGEAVVAASPVAARQADGSNKTHLT